MIHFDIISQNTIFDINQENEVDSTLFEIFNTNCILFFYI